MKPNKEETAELFELYAKGNSPMQCAVKFMEEKYKKLIGGSLYKFALLQRELYIKKEIKDPKYMFINRNTYNQLKEYVIGNNLFCIARELGHSEEFFMGMKIVICDIEDDEIVVGG